MRAGQQLFVDYDPTYAYSEAPFRAFFWIGPTNDGKDVFGRTTKSLDGFLEMQTRDSIVSRRLIDACDERVAPGELFEELGLGAIYQKAVEGFCFSIFSLLTSAIFLS